MAENQNPTKKFLKELNAGIASLLLLSVIAGREEPMYGYQIAKILDQDQSGGLSMKQSAYYPVLRSLENNALLESKVEPSTSGPPRRYYYITPLGLTILAEWKVIWHDTQQFVNHIMEGKTDV